MYQVILASQSPRRRQLLEEEGYVVVADTVKVSEYIEENVNITQGIIECAQRKGQAYVDANNHLKSKDYLVISADTVVVLGSMILGKPEDFQDAVKKLHLLSGKTHSVITAVVVFDLAQGQVVSFAEETQVQFRNLEQAEIQRYVESGEPMDKAGAYAIQGEGGQFVASTDGSWSNVVGFPIERFNQVVKENGWNLPRRSTQKN